MKITIEEFYKNKDKIAILIESKEELKKFCELSNKIGKTNYILVEFTEPIVALNSCCWQRLSDYEEILLKPENKHLKKYDFYKLKELKDE